MSIDFSLKYSWIEIHCDSMDPRLDCSCLLLCSEHGVLEFPMRAWESVVDERLLLRRVLVSPDREYIIRMTNEDRSVTRPLMRLRSAPAGGITSITLPR